jgi:hypothetical protein
MEKNLGLNLGSSSVWFLRLGERYVDKRNFINLLTNAVYSIKVERQFD